MPKPGFELREPAAQTIPYVFDSPHSGDCYPQDFLQRSRLDSTAIRRSEDAHIDALVGGVVALGAPLLAARFPRAWLDVNREPYELDPRMFDGPLPGHANTRSLRVAGGLGTIPRVVAEGHEIYASRLSVAEGLARIDGYYRPYHATLRRLIAQTAVRFGHAILIDCHSMPSSVSNGAANRPDIIVGDRYGTSCGPNLTRAAMQAFASRGYRIARNKPYAGGFMTEHYGRPLKGLHALQIEVNRGLYMNERTLQRTSGFHALRDDLTAIFAEMAALTLVPKSSGMVDPLTVQSLAAE